MMEKYSAFHLAHQTFRKFIFQGNLIKAYLCGLVLIGVATVAVAQAPDPTDACIANLPTQKELQILKGKIDLVSGPVSLETLSNTKKPTQNEKLAILAFDKTVEQCRELGKEWRIKNVPSTVNSMVDSAFSSLKLLLAELYAGRTTYGDFAKNRQELINKLGTQITAEVQRLQQIVAAENERKAREEEDRRQFLRQEEQRNKAIAEAEERRRQVQAQAQAQSRAIECQATRQQILAAVDEQARARAVAQANREEKQRREALEYARLSPQERATYGFGRAGQQLGSAFGALMGVEEGLEAQERRIQEAIQRYKAS
jgi:hypothetical protein